MPMLTVPMMLRRRYNRSRRINARHALEPIMTQKDVGLYTHKPFKLFQFFLNETFNKDFDVLCRYDVVVIIY